MPYSLFRSLTPKLTIKHIMKRIIYILPIILLSLTSCEEQTPDRFMDMTGVYFNNTSTGMTVTDSLDLTFVYEASDVLEVPVRVQLIGRAADFDRPLSITVESEDAVEGVDYILPASPVLPAGEYSTDYLVTLKRTESLKMTRKMIELHIHANEHFDLPVTELAQIADTVSVLSMRIYFSDMFTKSPAAWEENLIGKFTQQKFELICKVLAINPADFNDPSVVTLAKMLYISAEMTAYVDAETEKKKAGEAYDTDAFEPETGEPLTFRK